MTQYNTLSAKLYNSQLNKLKSGKQNDLELKLKFLSNAVGDYNNETYFQHKLLLININLSRLRKAIFK